MYKKYKIVFLDPTGDTAWRSKEELKNFYPEHCVIEGYIFSKDKKLIKTFASYSVDENANITAFGDCNVLPTNCVIKIIKLKESK